MATIQYEVPNNVQRMTIGVQGENNVREFLFDVTEWRQITGDIGTAEMVVQRNGDASPYAAAITMHDENTVSWIPTSADTEKVGVGKLQLMWIASGQTVKTKIFDMKVDPSLDYALPDASLDPWASWMPGILIADANYKRLANKVESIRQMIASPYKTGEAVADMAALEAIQDPEVNEAHYVVSENCRYGWTGTTWTQVSMDESKYADELAAVQAAEDRLSGTYQVSTAGIGPWEQGTLKGDTGAEINSSTRCRSAWIPFPGLDRVVVSAAEGYKLSARVYDRDRAFIEAPFSGWKTEAVLYPSGGRLYRFVVALADDAACPVSDLPEDVLVSQGYETEAVYALEHRRNLMLQTLEPVTAPAEARPKIGNDGFLWKVNGTPYAVSHGMGIVTTSPKRPALWFTAGYLDDSRAGLETGVDYVFSCKLRWKLLDPQQESAQRNFTIYLVEVTAGQSLPSASDITASMATKITTFPVAKGVAHEEKVTFAFTLAQTTTKFGLYFLCNRLSSEFLAGDFIELQDLMLQKGIRPTPWQPSLLDVLNNSKTIDEELVCKLQQLNRKTRISGSSFGPAPLVLLHFSDIHADDVRLGNIIKFKRDYSQYVTDVLHTGDSVKSYASDGMDFWSSTDGAESILNCIGNHDTRTSESMSGVNMDDAYDMVMAPFIANWNVVSETGKTYYYKDYATPGVRLIVLDIMHQTQEQLSWFRDTLSDARAKGLHVISACHSYAHWLLDYQDTPWDDHPIIVARGKYAEPEDTSGTAYPRNLSDDYAETVDAHLDAGGYFVCWLHGHTHFKVFAALETHPRQLDVAVANAGFANANTYIWERVLGSKSEDDFNLLAVDTYSHILRIVKVGVDYDVFLRHTDTISYDYDAHRLLYSN